MNKLNSILVEVRDLVKQRFAGSLSGSFGVTYQDVLFKKEIYSG